MSTVRVPGPLTRLARRHGLTRSRLCRSTDRVEAAVTAGAVVLAVLAVLLAAIVAMGSYQRAQGEAATKAAQQISVTAVLLTDAAVPFTDSSKQGVADQATALARWQLPKRAATHRAAVGQCQPPCGRPVVDLDRSARQPPRPAEDTRVDAG